MVDDLLVALIGYGLAGATFHAPVIAATSGLRLATVVTSNVERADAARARHPGVEIVPAVEDLWATADRHDVVVVAAHNRVHVPLGLAAIAAARAASSPGPTRRAACCSTSART